MWVALWCIQLALDTILIGGAWLWIRDRHRALMGESESGLEFLRTYQTRVLQLEAEIQKCKDRMEEQLSRLSKICEEAGRLLGRTGISSLTQTLEEQELRSVAARSAIETALPTVNEMTQNKKRLTSEITVDLRALLQDQLT